MGTVSIRVSEATRQRLRQIAAREHRSMRSVADEAVRAYERDQRWRAAEEAMARLRADPEEWKDYQAEASRWDVTSTDELGELSYDHRG